VSTTMIRLPIALACAVLVTASAVAQTPTASPSGSQTSGATQNPPAKPPAKPPVLPTTPGATPPPAPAVAFATDTRVGFVNMQVVVAASELGKKGGVLLKAFQDRKSAELTAKNKEIVDLQKDIDQSKGILAPSVLQTKNLDLQRKQRELDLIQQNADAEYQATNEQLLTDFSEKSMPIVKALAEEKKLYFVITEQSQVVYVAPSVDLTTEVIKRLDLAYPKDKGQ